MEGAVSGPPSCRTKVRVGCPAATEVLDSGACVAFLPTCSEGCSRWRAMAECEATGGALVDSLGLRDLLDLMQLAARKHGNSTWWTAASDFRKVEGKFTWEGSGLPVSDAMELWANGTYGWVLLNLGLFHCSLFFLLK